MAHLNLIYFFIDHGAEGTRYLKKFIGDHYVYYDTPIFKALWKTYNECQFVDNEGKLIPLFSLYNRLACLFYSGDVLFYRNKRGHVARRPEKD